MKQPSQKRPIQPSSRLAIRATRKVPGNRGCPGFALLDLPIPICHETEDLEKRRMPPEHVGTFLQLLDSPDLLRISARLARRFDQPAFSWLNFLLGVWGCVNRVAGDSILSHPRQDELAAVKGQCTNVFAWTFVLGVPRAGCVMFPAQ